MSNIKRKKNKLKSEIRKTVVGIKLPPVEPDNDSVKTIMDIDPSYYSSVEGRPIRANTSIQLYKQNIKDIAIKRAVHGFLVDEMLRIDREIESERHIYETAVRHFEEYQNSFNKFLADDNNKTIAIMKKSDLLAKELVNQIDEFKRVSHDMASLKSKIQYIDETLMILLSFQDFLNKASPKLWQEKCNINQNFQYTELFCIDSNILRKIDLETVAKRISMLPAPKLYFETTDQLITAFNIMEKQNLNYLLATEELNSEKNKFLNSANLFKKFLSLEFGYIEQKITEMQETIKQKESKEMKLKNKFYRILDDKIKYLISSETVLKVFNYVEFAYEKLIASNDTKISILSMALAVENEYDNLMLNISTFNLEKVKEIELETYENSCKEVERAQKASKLLKDVDKLNRRLKASYDIPHIVKPKKSQPFRVPQSEKLLSYIRYSDKKEKLSAKERLSQPLHLKDNLRIAATRDMSKRLFIEEPPDDVRAVVEIHPEFYTVIEGRPLRCFDDIKVYVNNIRSYAMNKQQIGYRRDLLMKIEQNINEESLEHDNIAENLKHHIKNFQKFLTEDYKKACAKVAKSEKVYLELVAKDSEFLGYISTLTIVNNHLFKLDAMRSTLKTYRSFLIFVSPLSWRQQHDETLRGKIQSIQFEAGEFATENDLVEYLDIDKMVELARSELECQLPAQLYFTKPEEIMYLFTSMELQSREYLKELSKTDAPFRLLQDRIKQLKQATKQELDYFQYYIDFINEEILRESSNEAYLQEKFFRILNDSFFDSVASPAILKLKICIEYVYEQVLGKCEEGHQNLQDPMKILELMYEDYNLRLDYLDFKIVNQAKNDLFAQDLKMMRNAYKAQRELRAFREMTNAMNKAFLPPVQYKRPVLKKFLDKKGRMAQAIVEKRKLLLERGERLKQKKYKLTEEEREGLMMFTEWCEGINPAPYLMQYYKYTKPAFDWVPRKSVH